MELEEYVLKNMHNDYLELYNNKGIIVDSYSCLITKNEYESDYYFSICGNNPIDFNFDIHKDSIENLIENKKLPIDLNTIRSLSGFDETEEDFIYYVENTLQREDYIYWESNEIEIKKIIKEIYSVIITNLESNIEALSNKILEMYNSGDIDYNITRE